MYQADYSICFWFVKGVSAALDDDIGHNAANNEQNDKSQWQKHDVRPFHR